MKLADIRKLAIRQQYRIAFVLKNGLECVVTEHGIAQVPSLATVPDFSLESELPSVQRFSLQPVVSGEKKKKVPPVQTVSYEQLAAMTAAGVPESVHHDDPDE